jgi:hypothetical protein
MAKIMECTCATMEIKSMATVALLPAQLKKIILAQAAILILMTSAHIFTLK